MPEAGKCVTESTPVGGLGLPSLTRERNRTFSEDSQCNSYVMMKIKWVVLIILTEKMVYFWNENRGEFLE